MGVYITTISCTDLCFEVGKNKQTHHCYQVSYHIVSHREDKITSSHFFLLIMGCSILQWQKPFAKTVKNSVCSGVCTFSLAVKRL